MDKVAILRKIKLKIKNKLEIIKSILIGFYTDFKILFHSYFRLFHY